LIRDGKTDDLDRVWAPRSLARGVLFCRCPLGFAPVAAGPESATGGSRTAGAAP